MSFTDPNRWERFTDTLCNRMVARGYYRRFADLLDLQGQERVLDFGCGSGALACHLAPRLAAGGHLTCLDTSPALLAIARRRLRHHRHITYHCADARQAPIAPGASDWVTIHFVLHDVAAEDRASVLRALVAALTPRGRLAIREPYRAAHGMPVEEVRALASGAGLREVFCEYSRAFLTYPTFLAHYTR